MRALALVLILPLLIGCGNPATPDPTESPDAWYRMRTATDCGPAAVAFATQIPYSIVCSAWGWPNYGDGRDDLADTPLSHYAALRALGWSYRIRTAGEILRGECPANQTIVLLHGTDSILSQHWAVLGGLDQAGNVLLLFGDKPEPRVYNPTLFQEYYSRGTPAVAYSVHRPPPRQF